MAVFFAEKSEWPEGNPSDLIHDHACSSMSICGRAAS